MQTPRVFFSNVPFSTTPDEILALFEQYGNIAEFNPFLKENGQFKGMGRCVFSTVNEAQSAIAALLDVDVGGRPLWVAEDTIDQAGGGGKGSTSKGGSSAGKGKRPMGGREPHGQGFAAIKGGPKAVKGPFRAGYVPVRTPMAAHQHPQKSIEAEVDNATGGRVFFSNVPFFTTEATLGELFEQVGPVKKLNLFQGSKGFRGMGVCIYHSPADAATAIVELRDVDVDGRPIWTSEDVGRDAEAAQQVNQYTGGPIRPISSAPIPSAPAPFSRHGSNRNNIASVQEPTAVFFSNVAFTTTVDVLGEVFSQAGTVLDIKLFERGGKSRGMGVCSFELPESARWAVQNLRECDVEGRPLWVQTHAEGQVGRQEVGSCRVFFSNVPFDVEEDMLAELFEEVGRFTELRLFREGGKEGTKSKGMGICVYEAPGMASAAIRNLRDRDMGGRPIWISEDTAGPRDGPGGFGGCAAPMPSFYGPAPRMAPRMPGRHGPYDNVGHGGPGASGRRPIRPVHVMARGRGL